MVGMAVETMVPSTAVMKVARNTATVTGPTLVVGATFRSLTMVLSLSYGNLILLCQANTQSIFAGGRSGNLPPIGQQEPYSMIGRRNDQAGAGPCNRPALPQSPLPRPFLPGVLQLGRGRLVALALSPD
ncbi:hypothetical protein CRD60_00605 [Bifidobacterium aemilianum]|uniref:Uncharacterized protein n=1 Tax=Bifidobacterium aemilianum TaxID=2493120 RepID=A0A366K9I2_9BIFI|nr:hypothetical protein CRD60_00605 [Bifidobacterium aemilianum]